MCEELIETIRIFTKAKLVENQYPPTTQSIIENAELKLGLEIPTLLKKCYLEIGNGGFGPGYGLIGLEGGYKSDYGDLIETVELLKSDQESEGREWNKGLLPFCEWGCNIFSCVDCNDPRHPVFTFENFAATQQNYTLDWFFELWMSANDILSHDCSDVDKVEITNPFSGKKQTVRRRQQN